jgi:hypothetical protein
VDFEKARICAGRCVLIDKHCVIYEEATVDVNCSYASTGLYLDFDLMDDVSSVTLEVFSVTGESVFSRSAAPSYKPGLDGCDDLYAAFQFNYGFGIGNGGAQSSDGA